MIARVLFALVPFLLVPERVDPSQRIGMYVPTAGADWTSGRTSSWPPSPVDLPTAAIDLTYTYPTGCDVIDYNVTPTGGCKILDVNTGENVQTALDLARRGDIVQLEADVTFTGPYNLPDKTGSGWVYVVTSALASMPAPMTRVVPDLGGTCNTEGALPCGVTPNTELTDFARIGSGGGNPYYWLTGSHGADSYRLIGIHFVTTSGEFVGTGMRLHETAALQPHTTLAQQVSDVIWDRCLMEGSYTTPFAGRAIALVGNRLAVINSYIWKWVDDDSDTQAVIASGYANVFAIVNNYLEATGENVFTDNTVTLDSTLYTPCDGEIRLNYIRKLVEWNSKSPTWNNNKNGFEMKSGCRMLFSDNILDTNYRQAQETAINIKIGDEGPPYDKFVFDVTIARNIVRHVANAIKTCASQCNSANNTNILDGLYVGNNIFDDVSTSYGDGSDGRCYYQLSTGPNTYIDHNTCITVGNAFGGVFQRATGVSDGEVLEISNNIFRHVDDSPTASEVTAISSVASYIEQLWVGGSSCTATYGATTQCPASYSAVGFVNFNGGNGGDYELSGSSEYQGDGTDPYGIGTTDPGANVPIVTQATACVVQGDCANWTLPPAPAPLPQLIVLKRAW